jgi:hypothetical protein
VGCSGEGWGGVGRGGVGWGGVEWGGVGWGGVGRGGVEWSAAACTSRHALACKAGRGRPMHIKYMYLLTLRGLVVCIVPPPPM